MTGGKTSQFTTTTGDAFVKFESQYVPVRGSSRSDNVVLSDGYAAPAVRTMRDDYRPHYNVEKVTAVNPRLQDTHTKQGNYAA